ncbi:MAG: hypothetical protein M5U18_08445 [Dehalococcoidia bacterium]|nr:hypothetical protein [Dehalococcoidia bacterium]
MALADDEETLEISASSDSALVSDEVSDELIARAWASATIDELLALVDIGLPEWLLDEVAQYLQRGSARRAKPIQITLLRNRVIERFFGPVLAQAQSAPILEVTLVTPWVTPWAGTHSSLERLLEMIRRRRIPVTLITRPPTLEMHRVAVEQFRAIPSAEVILLSDLHAKYYVCEMPPVPFAMLGSANATQGSLSNYELGVMVRGSGSAETFVRNLQSLTNELRVIGTRTKKRGA